MDDSLAWAAGLFEGEGCFNWYRRSSGKLQVQVRLGMTDRDVVERFASVVGVGHAHEGRKIRPHEKPFFEWYVQDATNVEQVIIMLMPWLGERRKAKAQEVLAVARQIQPHNEKKTHCPNGHAYADDNLVLEPIHDGKYMARRCRVCRNAQARQRARQRLGITPDRYRVA